MSLLAVPLHKLEFGQAVSYGEDLVPVRLIDVANALHTLLVPKVESEFVLDVELPSSLLLR